MTDADTTTIKFDNSTSDTQRYTVRYETSTGVHVKIFDVAAGGNDEITDVKIGTWKILKVETIKDAG